MMLANCYLSMGVNDRAVEQCEASLRKNRYHLPTLRALLIAQFELGNVIAAKETLRTILTLQPDLTLERYLAAGRQSRLRQRGARVLEALGLPRH
jgi:tetratricopeptide (TPR) repeat protein